MRALLAVAALAALASGARADDLTVTGPDGAAAVERAHTVAVEVRERVARFAVTRTLANPGDRVAEVELRIALPVGAVARDLRVRAGDRWLRGELIATDDAVARYAALTTDGAQQAHGPALLRWNDGEGLVLAAYPVRPRGAITVAYTLEAPACFAHGRWITDYPRATDDLAPVAITGHGPRGAARVLTAAQLATALGQPITDACAGDVGLGDDPTRAYVVVDAPAIARADVDRPGALGGARATLDRVRVGAAMVSTVRLEVAPELAAVPRGLRVVFVVDASASEGEPGIAAQLAWIRAYVGRVPDAQVEIVAYRRWAERLFGGWRTGRDAGRALAQLPPSALAPGNGSHFDRGLAAAAELLARAPAGPARLIAFTDERWRPSWSAEQATAALAGLPRGAIVHVVRLPRPAPGTSAALTRTVDDAPLAIAAAATGGIAVDATGGGDATASGFAAAVEVLVRPIQLDGLTITGGVAAAIEVDPLDGGRGRSFTWLDGADQPVVVEGAIWGRRWRQTLTAPADAARYAGLVIGDAIRDQLSLAATDALARLGHVVSPGTALLAVDARWPAAGRPDDWTATGRPFPWLSTSYHTSARSHCGIGAATVLPTLDVRPLAALLEPRVRVCAVTARISRWHLAITVDTTDTEIVDVGVHPAVSADTSIADAAAIGGAAHERFIACVEDAAWELRLDDRFRRPEGHLAVTVAGRR